MADPLAHSPGAEASDTTAEAIEELVQGFLRGDLPRARWSHRAHLLVGLWHLQRYPADQALGLLRQRIRRYNTAVGVANTDHSGYHETLTRFYLEAIQAELSGFGVLQALAPSQRPAAAAALLASPLAEVSFPLRVYSRQRLFSVAARRQWLPPEGAGRQPDPRRCQSDAMDSKPPPNWWGRNWRWVVPAGCLTAVAGVVGFIALIVGAVFGLLQSATPYRQALARAQADPVVISRLGRPISAGWLMAASLNRSGGTGQARLAIPLQGSRGRGTLFVEARQTGRRWTYSTLTLQPDNSGERLNLLRPTL